MRTDTSLLRLLGQIETLTASRDREQLAVTVVSAARDLMGASFSMLHKLSLTPLGYCVTPLAWAVEGSSSSANVDSAELDDNPLSADPLLQECVSTGISSAYEDGGDIRLAFLVGDAASAVAIFEARCSVMATESARECVMHLLRIYAKHLHLLDYAELDTLTKLHNRKTFDENFDRFIEMAEQALRQEGDERRNENDAKASRPCWLGVVDIDRFKRINDNFGHLFGDEVLLRIAEVMKKSFRASDKLFRFGGEEFVVMLRHASAEHAHMVLDRFRQAVEDHEFPQVGKVTCSMGYMEILPNLTPAEILGQADQALYFSKENGRNQINCYGLLVAQGLIMAPVTTQTDANIQADIDALFD